MADRPLTFWLKAARGLMPIVRQFRALPEADRKNWQILLPLLSAALAALSDLGLTLGDLSDIVANEDVRALLEELA